MTRIYVESVAGDPDFLRMELMSALEGSKTASAFFERRWRSITDYIEYSLNELQESRSGLVCHPRMAGLMFQGMLREILYTRFIASDARYHDIPLQTMVNELIRIFVRGIGMETAATAK
jgi:hypothetical protein